MIKLRVLASPRIQTLAVVSTLDEGLALQRELADKVFTSHDVVATEELYTKADCGTASHCQWNDVVKMCFVRLQC